MHKHLYRLIIIFWLFPNLSYALSDIHLLEQALLDKGESPTLIFNLSKAYLKAGDHVTAALYFEYFEQLQQEVISKNEIQALKNAIEKYKAEPPKSFNKRETLISTFQFGFDTNANQGSDRNIVSFDLDSGETLDLLIDDKNKKTSSSFSSLGLTYNYLPENIDAIFSSAIDTIQYTSTNEKNSTLFRSGLYFRNHSLTVFHYDAFQSINGLIYLGQHNDWKWLVRHQTDRNILGISKEQPITVLSHKLSSTLGIFKDRPLDNRAGGDKLSLNIQLEAKIRNLTLGYRVEFSKDSDPYNAIFYPTTKDSHTWQTLKAEYPIFRDDTTRLSFAAQFDNKDSEIDINSWQGLSANLIYKKLF